MITSVAGDDGTSVEVFNLNPYIIGSLEIEFTSSRTPTYTYPNVPLLRFNGLVTASSPGTFYNAHIKGVFESVNSQAAGMATS